MYIDDLAQCSTAERRKKCRAYWYRAVCFTKLERAITPFSFPPPPKPGTHGYRVDFNKGFFRTVPDEELDELFLILKPYFAQAQHRDTDLS